MKTHTYTSEPWLAVEHSWSRIGIYSGEKCIAALDIYDQATEENEDALGKEMAENARLMSAAPDLLEAMRTLLDCFVDDPLSWMNNQSEAIEKARDAVIKATGE